MPKVWPNLKPKQIISKIFSHRQGGDLGTKQKTIKEGFDKLTKRVDFKQNNEEIGLRGWFYKVF